jgi:hypothetical protein
VLDKGIRSCESGSFTMQAMYGALTRGNNSVIEGLYCFLNLHPWSTVGKMLDERIWVDVPR